MECDRRSYDSPLCYTAVSLAKTADRVVLALGTDLSNGKGGAHEGVDASTLLLSPEQTTLLDQVTAVAAKPVVVVLMTIVAVVVMCVTALSERRRICALRARMIGARLACRVDTKRRPAIR